MIDPATLNQAAPVPQNPRPIVAIGTGAIVRHAHWPAYNMAGFPVHSAFDTNPEAARALAEEFGVRHVCATLEESVKTAPADAVFDVSVPAIAIIPVLEALPDGAAVLVQKPLGENLEQALAIQELARRKGLFLACNFQLRFAPYALAVRDLVDRGVLGKILEIDVKVNVRTPWELWDFLEKAPRMEFVYHSIHYLDLIRSFLGEPQRVLASTIKHPASPKLHSSRSAAILDYGEWQRATLVTNHGHRWGTRHQQSEMRFEGEKGCAVFQMGLNMNYPEGEPDYLEFIGEGMETWQRVPLAGSWFPHAFVGTMGSLMKGLEDPAYVVPTRLDDAVETMRLVEQAYECSDAS